MKKVLLAVLAGVLCVPAFAQQDAEKTPANGLRPAVHGQKADFKQARAEHMAQMKATREKLEKLVAEYDKLKAGKKKEAKKAEIAQVVAGIHEQQIKFKEEQLAQFEKRLEQMKQDLAAQNTPEAKTAWVDEKTEKLIEQKGDVKVLFDRPKTPEMAGPGSKEHHKGLMGPNRPGKPGYGPKGAAHDKGAGDGPREEMPQ